VVSSRPTALNCKETKKRVNRPQFLHVHTTFCALPFIRTGEQESEYAAPRHLSALVRPRRRRAARSTHTSRHGASLLNSFLLFLSFSFLRSLSINAHFSLCSPLLSILFGEERG
jgi:hypothetical protein